MNLLHNIPPEFYEGYFGHHEGQAWKLGLGVEVCAEDPNWDTHPIPRLSELCVFTLARFFTRKPSVVDFLHGKDKALYLDLLSTQEPLTMTAEHIHDDAYWKRCCIEIYRVCDVEQHEGSFKRMFIERHLQGLLETFRPMQMDIYDIKELLPILEPFVKKLNVTTLLPPVVLVTQSHQDANDDEDELSISSASNDGDEVSNVETGLKPKSENSTPRGSTPQSNVSGEELGPNYHPTEINMKVPPNHLDFGQILPYLSELEEFDVSYQLKNCGTDFRWNIYGMTARDSDYLSLGLKSSKNLRKLSICKSNMDDDNFYDIYDGLKHVSKLEILELTNNMLTDESMNSLVRIMLCNRVVHLDLTNNNVQEEGAEILAKFVSPSESKCRLKRLILSLNNLRSEGSIVLCEALARNKTLQTLDISSNRLDSKCTKAIAKLLRSNQTLKVLNLANNEIGLEGGLEITQGFAMNTRIQILDMRLTNCGKDVDLAVQRKLKENKGRPSSWSIRQELQQKLNAIQARPGELF